MAVRFTPVGAHLFLGVPMRELSSRAIALADFDPQLSRRILGRVGAAKGWGARFDAMEALIADRLAQKSVPGAVVQVWERIASGEGRVAIARLAADVEYGQRRLATEFHAHIGFAPKTVAQLFRFNRAVRLLNRRVRNAPDKIASKPYLEAAATRSLPAVKIAWADLASACGYFDQAHFIREFQRFSGLTPTAFLRSLSDTD
jgi:AraC-like DNA-binding protein